jgi:hypothetical protein
MLVFEECNDLLAALEDVQHDPRVTHLRSKNRFENPAPGGWRDYLMNVKMEASDHICEIQVRLSRWIQHNNQ